MSRLLLIIGLVCLSRFALAQDASPLPGTQPLTMEGDIAAQLVEGVDRFLLRKLKESADKPHESWTAGDGLNDEDRRKFQASRRETFARMIGAADNRVPFDAPQLLATTAQSALVGEGPIYKAYAVRWPTVRDLFAEGLLVVPNDASVEVSVICIPDADQTPEQILGLVEGVPPESQFARHAAERGCRVLIPTLISRKYEARNGRAKMTNREFIHRSAFELGRHIIGYEVQEVLAGVDWFEKEKTTQIGVIGYGEGGLIGLYAAALDPRISKVWVSGYVGPKQDVWKQPLDRNVFGILNGFTDVDVVRRLLSDACHVVVEHADYPNVNLPSEGGAPGAIVRPTFEEFAAALKEGIEPANGRVFTKEQNKVASHAGGIDGEAAARSILHRFEGARERSEKLRRNVAITPPVAQGKFDADARQSRLMHVMDRHNQWLLSESPYVRAEFMKGLDTSSPEKYAATSEVYREQFKREVIGWFDDERLPFNARSRKMMDAEKFSGYEVVLDVWSDVIAYGILLVPKDVKDGERRPVVVCQHGLEGRPQDVVQGNHPAYHDFAAKLAERGFITFSPQNLYIGKDKFRTLQRKANPLGKTLFSVIVPQHQQIVDWLKTQPNVDPRRIAFYGLSYGGKSAMRIPPLVPDYCLSICSADFNEWVVKNASTRSPYSYVWTNEYEIFEWNLGATFNYAEMAALIAPRPFMVERGHFDGVASDDAVGSEFAKVFRLYNAQLRLGDRCEIEWFAGPHTINGKGTFAFLHKHLNLPAK